MKNGFRKNKLFQFESADHDRRPYSNRCKDINLLECRLSWMVLFDKHVPPIKAINLWQGFRQICFSYIWVYIALEEKGKSTQFRNLVLLNVISIPAYQLVVVRSLNKFEWCLAKDVGLKMFDEKKTGCPVWLLKLQSNMTLPTLSYMTSLNLIL